jgi:hypothetical protein
VLRDANIQKLKKINGKIKLKTCGVVSSNPASNLAETEAIISIFFFSIFFAENFLQGRDIEKLPKNKK